MKKKDMVVHMKFYRYFNAGDKGVKMWGNAELTSDEVREDIKNSTNNRHFYLPVYQHRGMGYLPMYSPCKGIGTIEELEEFLRPKQKTFVWDDEQWKLKIHTPEELLDFYETLMDRNGETNRFVQNIENIKKSTSQYDVPVLKELSDCVDKDSSAYRFGVYQGQLMYFQMEEIEKRGGILISKNLEYRFLRGPVELFPNSYVHNCWDYPEEALGIVKDNDEYEEERE